MKIQDVKYKWSKLFAVKRLKSKTGIAHLDPLEQEELLTDLDQAAASIMELVDKEKIEFAEFLREGYSNKWHGYVQNHWHKLGDSDHQKYTTAELLTIFSQSKTAK